jgi:hypothetical protein
METPDSGEKPNPAEDPSNRDSRGSLDVPGIGGEKTPSSSFEIKTLEFAKRAPEEWEKKLKVVLKK